MGFLVVFIEACIAAACSNNRLVPSMSQATSVMVSVLGMFLAVAEEILTAEGVPRPVIHVEKQDAFLMATRALLSGAYAIVLRHCVGAAPVEVTVGTTGAISSLLMFLPGLILWFGGWEGMPTEAFPVIGWGILAAFQHALLSWAIVNVGPLSAMLAAVAAVPVTVMTRTIIWRQVSIATTHCVRVYASVGYMPHTECEYPDSHIMQVPPSLIMISKFVFFFFYFRNPLAPSSWSEVYSFG